MTAYVDASAVVKLYVDDEGPGFDLAPVTEVFDSLTTSRLTYVETMAALAAMRRAGRLTPARHAAALGEFAVLWATFTVIDLSDDVTRDAGEVAETFGLRTACAIHLASLRALDAPAVPLIAWDARLRAAALADGYICYPLEV